MLRSALRVSAVLTLLAGLPARAPGQPPPATSSAVVAHVRDAVRRCDDALRRADTAAIGQFFAPEYVFVNARGERPTRADRVANLRTGRTSVDTVAHAPEEEQIRPYGRDVVLYSTLLTLCGRYSGKTQQQGRYRALVVWVRRGGRWQQVASQLTQIADATREGRR